jgi:predicted KAP-like P-loop ATPase
MTAEFVIEDVPASPAKFNFDILAQTLLDVVIRPRQGAFVLGIHGSWGSGKTTLMNAMQTLLYQQSDVVIVEFNAWKYHQREALWRALIIQVLETLKKDNVGGSEIVEMERSLYASFTAHEQGSLQFNWSAAVTEALLLSIRLGTANLAGGVIDRIGDFLNMIFNRKSTADDAKTEDVAKSVERVSSIFSRKIIERSVEQVISIEQFLSRFRRLVRELSGGKRIYVIVDDLDRCLPESALEVFEAIKLFLDAPECTYIVALDRDVIRRGLALRYISGSDIVNTDEYIEKQSPFHSTCRHLH